MLLQIKLLCFDKIFKLHSHNRNDAASEREMPSICQCFDMHLYYLHVFIILCSSLTFLYTFFCTGEHFLHHPWNPHLLHAVLSQSVSSGLELHVIHLVKQVSILSEAPVLSPLKLTPALHSAVTECVFGLTLHLT